MPSIKNRGLHKNKGQARNAENSRTKQKKLELNTPIEEMRVTKKKASERKERSISDIGQALRGKKKSDEEKYIRSLRKQLRAIEELMMKQAAGVELDEQQLMKIDRLPSLVQELEELG